MGDRRHKLEKDDWFTRVLRFARRIFFLPSKSLKMPEFLPRSLNLAEVRCEGKSRKWKVESGNGSDKGGDEGLELPSEVNTASAETLVRRGEWGWLSFTFFLSLAPVRRPLSLGTCSRAGPFPLTQPSPRGEGTIPVTPQWARTYCNFIVVI
jgi:hypothetical protein